MKFKKNDHLTIPSKDEINSFHPEFDEESMKLYFYYVIERFNIQKVRESGKEFPWTEDKILQENSFTCNRREDDRTTKWLLNNITHNSKLSNEEKFWRSILFRLYNKIETAELMHLESEDNIWDNQDTIKALEDYDRDPYTRAYRIIRLKYHGRDNHPELKNWKPCGYLTVSDLRNKYNKKIPDVFFNGSAYDAFESLRSEIKGIGNFLTMQLIVDLMYCDFIPFSNNALTISGPGSQAGLHRIIKDFDKMNYEQALWYIYYNFEDLCKRYYDESFSLNTFREYYNDENALCPPDIQNTFCEYSKFRYIMDGTHKKKRKYIQHV